MSVFCAGVVGQYPTACPANVHPCFYEVFERWRLKTTYKNPFCGVCKSVRKIRWRRWLILPVVISLAAGVAVLSRHVPTSPELNPQDNNPDKFYLWTTGKGYSFRFTYNPHAADAWMFRTAEGHLESSNVLNYRIVAIP